MVGSREGVVQSLPISAVRALCPELRTGGSVLADWRVWAGVGEALGRPLGSLPASVARFSPDASKHPPARAPAPSWGAGQGQGSDRPLPPLQSPGTPHPPLPPGRGCGPGQTDTWPCVRLGPDAGLGSSSPPHGLRVLQGSLPTFPSEDPRLKPQFFLIPPWKTQPISVAGKARPAAPSPCCVVCSLVGPEVVSSPFPV